MLEFMRNFVSTFKSNIPKGKTIHMTKFPKDFPYFDSKAKSSINV